MSYAITPPSVVSVPVFNTQMRYPINHIYCVGRNYAAHAREMGHDPDREPPFFFSKPADAVVYIAPNETGVFPYPSLTTNCHYEMELVVALSKGGKDIPVEQAHEYIYGYALGLDMTRRDLQNEAKKLGRPWETGKAFAHSAPMGPIHSASQVQGIAQSSIWLKVNNELKQQASIADLIWSIPESIAYLSTLFELKAGDLIFTGTPEGVGAITPGDIMTGGVDGLGEFSIKVV